MFAAIALMLRAGSARKESIRRSSARSRTRSIVADVFLITSGFLLREDARTCAGVNPSADAAASAPSSLDSTLDSAFTSVLTGGAAGGRADGRIVSIFPGR